MSCAAGASNNYFIVGTIAATVSDSDTVDVEATGAGSVSAGVTSVVAITLTGTSTNSTRAVTETTAPTLSITLSDSNLSHGQTALVTFTFSEAPTEFTSADVTTPNGTLGTIDTTNPLVQTATFTPTNHISDSSNVITVGTSWTDSSAGLNPPAGVSTSANYKVETSATSSGGGSGGSSNNTVVPATPATHTLPADCLPGVQFSPSTGRNCNAATPAVPASPSTTGYAFGYGLVKQGSKGEACRAWQMFFDDKAAAHLDVDGICGPLTIGVARGWQSTRGLMADGILGPMSRGKANMQ